MDPTHAYVCVAVRFSAAHARTEDTWRRMDAILAQQVGLELDTIVPEIECVCTVWHVGVTWRVHVGGAEGDRGCAAARGRA